MINKDEFIALVENSDKSPIDKNIDVIFNYIDDLALDGKLDDIDYILKHINVEKLDLHQTLSFCTITNCHKQYLKNREDYLNKAITHVSNYETPERIKKLFGGYEKSKPNPINDVFRNFMGYPEVVTND